MQADVKANVKDGAKDNREGDRALHLTYCSNIHPGETWAEVKQNLETYLPALKQRLSPESPFGIGLRLSDLAAREILEQDHLKAFKTWLEAEDLYVFTINGFPYGGFHHQVVKDNVYAPDWSKPERLDYTLRLVEILSALLPDGMDGGISTVPLSYKPWWVNDSDARDIVFAVSTQQLAQITARLVTLEQQGQQLHIDLEPEPDGLLENAAEVIAYFNDWLLPIGGAQLGKELGISQAQAEQHLLNHIQICYDTCHFAVEYEHPQQVFEQFRAAGIKIGKGQLSAALKIELPSDVEKRQWMATQLEAFAESTYLHQVIERGGNGELKQHADLQKALPHFVSSDAKEWRTHFHVPIFVDRYQAFQSTQAEITSFLAALKNNLGCSHLEIETYTWDVLPAEMKLDMLTSIQREYEWVLENFA
ncbi:metabolite traffic protein EboE [cf. Phormidesmis sp. LEGE 11477]|nr:metabolite traffic protein EboE [cf. Phormidesmis sp. LEGE 11477]